MTTGVHYTILGVRHSCQEITAVLIVTFAKMAMLPFQTGYAQHPKTLPFRNESSLLASSANGLTSPLR